MAAFELARRPGTSVSRDERPRELTVREKTQLPARVAAADVPIPYNRDLESHVRPTPEKVVEAVRSLLDAHKGVYA